MATHANTTVNETKQARTCAALLDAFCDADDAYQAAVEQGDMDREAVTDARSEALVAFQTGPRPINTTEAHQVIFAALRAVVDGNDFDVAWRATVCPALAILGVRGAAAAAPLSELSLLRTDYHVGRYQDYLKALAALAARPDETADDVSDALHDEADEIFDDLMEGGATTFTGVMLKARAAQHWTMQRAQGSLMSPRILAELFGIIAADLEILTARKAVRP